MNRAQFHHVARSPRQQNISFCRYRTHGVDSVLTVSRTVYVRRSTCDSRYGYAEAKERRGLSIDVRSVKIKRYPSLLALVECFFRNVKEERLSNMTFAVKYDSGGKTAVHAFMKNVTLFMYTCASILSSVHDKRSIYHMLILFGRP